MIVRINFHPDKTILRQFAGLWLLFFAALGAWQSVVEGRSGLGLGLIALAIAFGAAGLVRPGSVRWLYVIAMVLAFPIGLVVSHLLLALLYFCVFTPLSLVFRLAGRDVLRLERPEQPSYWQIHSQPADVRRYFRPF